MVCSPRVGGKQAMEQRGFSARHAWDNAFWLGFVATSWLAVIMGFLAPVAGRLAGKAPYAAPPILVAHVFVYIGWMCLLTLQVLLVNRGRVAWHRKIGMAGMVLAVLVVLTGLDAEIYSQRFWARTDPENVRFFTFPVYVVLSFGTCALLAYRARRVPATHKRLIFLATAMIMGGPYQRWWGHTIDSFTGTGPFNTWAHLYTGTNLLMLVAAGYDRLTRGAVHPVLRIGIPLVVAGQLVAIAIWYSDWWPHFVRHILSIPTP